MSNVTTIDKAAEELDEKWKTGVLASPQFSCGRLDMQSWDASDGVPEKYVYVEGDDERYQIKGRYCDEIAYAAAHYQDAIRQIEQLRIENESLKKRLGAAAGDTV